MAKEIVSAQFLKFGRDLLRFYRRVLSEARKNEILYARMYKQSGNPTLKSLKDFWQGQEKLLTKLIRNFPSKREISKSRS